MNIILLLNKNVLVINIIFLLNKFMQYYCKVWNYMYVMKILIVE